MFPVLLHYGIPKVYSMLYRIFTAIPVVQSIGAVFADFRKAFDFADHNILGYKLQARSITVSLEIGIAR